MHSLDDRLPQRFWDKVEPDPSGCLVWTAALRTGYGMYSIRSKPVAAHRYHWEAVRGPVPDALVVDHLCRNRACVNLDHLRVTTIQQNVATGLAGQLKTWCRKRLHRLDVADNVIVCMVRGAPVRRCRTFAGATGRLTDQRYRERHPERYAESNRQSSLRWRQAHLEEARQRERLSKMNARRRRRLMANDATSGLAR